DPSNVREVLSYDILRKYMDAPLSNFAQVYINGTLRGLYSNDQSINKRFLGDHYYSAEGAFFKCNPVGGAGPGSQGSSPNLAWISSDSSSYFSSYEMQSDFGWNQLVDLIDTLNNATSSLDQILDIDRCLWMLAFNNVLVNLDSYTGNFKQNYYLYRDVNHRWVPTVWDLNMSFGGFPGNGLNVLGMQNLIPLYSSDAQHPLIQKLFNNPLYQRMYIAHMRTILSENFSNGEYLNRAQELMAVINNAVQTDPYPFFTYTQFQNSLTTNTTGGGGGPGGNFSIPGIQVLMDARSSFLATNALLTANPPVISQVAPTLNNPAFGSTLYITSNVSNSTQVELGYRFDHTRRFYRYPMLDDGLHQDGAANDGVYGAMVIMNGVSMEFYVYAENANAGMFSPERA
ncbi:MAG: CotH kinase family protein, partial [Flavobacteriales bacterium]